MRSPSVWEAEPAGQDFYRKKQEEDFYKSLLKANFSSQVWCLAKSFI